MKKIYLAGPLFSDAEKQFNIGLKKLLSPYFEVYLPQEDGKLLVDLVSQGMDVNLAKKQIFTYDIDAIKSCDIILIVLDGRTVDEGAAFELGFAYSLGKECLALHTDPRRLLDTGNNPMIDCALSITIRSVEELVAWAEKYVVMDTTLDNVSKKASCL